MNCDEAFEHMTDRYLHHSQAFQRHLAGCPRCRQMRETMAPALAYLNVPEADRSEREFPHSGSDRPAPRSSDARCFLSVEAVEVAEHAAQQLSARVTHRRFSSHRIVTTVIRYAAVFVIGAIVAFGTLPRDVEAPVPVNSVPSMTSGTCMRHDADKANAAQPAPDARNVILSCVACHMTMGPQRPEIEMFPKADRNIDGEAFLPRSVAFPPWQLLADRVVPRNLVMRALRSV